MHTLEMAMEKAVLLFQREFELASNNLAVGRKPSCGPRSKNLRWEVWALSAGFRMILLLA